MRFDEAGPSSTASASAKPRKAADTGLSFRCARTIEDVLAAWHLAYNSYRRRGIIAANRHQVFTSQNAVAPQSIVLMGQIGPVTVSTLTATVQGPFGLPIERTFEQEVRGLRLAGRRAMELHLFADRRADEERTIDAFMQLLSLGWSWGELHQVTDCLIAVEPSRAEYFRHAFGFEPVGEARLYKGLTGCPLSMLRCDIARSVSQPQPPLGLKFLLTQQTAPETFEERFMFDPAEVGRSAIGGFLSEKYKVRAAG